METKRPSSPRYHAYLLRIWLSNSAAEDACWHASLQDASGGQRIGFASLEELFVFLMNDVVAPATGGKQESDGGAGQ
jgi:hypothetical protein